MPLKQRTGVYGHTYIVPPDKQSHTQRSKSIHTEGANVNAGFCYEICKHEREAAI